MKIWLICLLISCAGWGTPAVAQGMGDGGWHVSQYIDKLSDKKITRGARQYNSTNYSVQVEVICSGRNLSYSFSTFNRSNLLGVPLSQPNMLQAYTPLTIRLDNEGAMNIVRSIDRFSNKVTIEEALSNDIDSIGAVQVALAKRVRLKLELQTGSTLIELDQTDPRIRFVLAQCVKATDLGARQRFQAEKKGRELQGQQMETRKKATADAAEKAENEKYDVPLTGLNFRSKGSCSFEQFGEVRQEKCEYWFPSAQPETATRMVVIKKSDDPSTNVDYWYRFNMPGDQAYVTKSLRDGSNQSRYQMKMDNGCWAGEDSGRAIRICIKPRLPTFQPE